ncbi:hypothetical protein LY90DRAFT_8783 [Neocallimastix californiae]|uniref:Uncharacterized protein n=1 Tax=Neocallimastix californiae TaxID=1754190 RepID=A0A1Y2CLT4_9FUNG|nr:hypothetical protein LY90DRAFT_8783 [Neocallimastix californiae]|eukprot:ORY47972.1 hypothetical protein LY90DRAFT_8783 [Neocallimastix californiae]
MIFYIISNNSFFFFFFFFFFKGYSLLILRIELLYYILNYFVFIIKIKKKII